MRLTLPSALAAAAISSTVVPHEAPDSEELADAISEPAEAEADVASEEDELEHAARSAEASTTGTTYSDLRMDDLSLEVRWTLGTLDGMK
jgi:hypothetical protein